MTVRTITTVNDLAALETEWNALADGMPLRSWDWLATWWKHYGGAGRQLFVLGVYADADDPSDVAEPLIGIAPWYLDRSAIKGSVIRWLVAPVQVCCCTAALSAVDAPATPTHSPANDVTV